MGRATPPPRAAAEMSDEEISQLIKDHDVLRKDTPLLEILYPSNLQQAKNIRKSSVTSSSSRLKYTSSKTLWQTSACRFRAHLGTTVNMLPGLIG